MWPMRLNHYHLISAPVVDADNRLVGVITIDDAMTAPGNECFCNGCDGRQQCYHFFT